MSNNPNNGDVEEALQSYSMHVSARYLDLTRRKLELTRLPREPPLSDLDRWRYGTPKTILEPLIDFWLEQYDWRAQEATLNNRLPQFRTTIALPNPNSEDATKRSFRIHFVHKRCQIQNGAIPLLFCHGWPGSFLEVCKIIDALTEPDFAALPPGARVPLGFHVVVPSIPGFGFSDACNETGFGLEETAEVFDALMKKLGYDEYVAHGSEWGFQLCRQLSLSHKRSCLAIHTISPNFPPPTFQTSVPATVKYHVARMGSARFPQLSFGYTPSELQQRPEALAAGPGNVRAITTPFTLRPQTRAYSLCDSPVGLLSCMLDILQPHGLTVPPKPRSNPSASRENMRPSRENMRLGAFMESIPESVASLPPPPAWTPADVLNWTMMQWLPGPEAGLRWLYQSRRESSMRAPTSIWSSWSSIPLGISTFRTPVSGRPKRSIEQSIAPTEEEIGTLKQAEQRPWHKLGFFGRKKEEEEEAAPLQRASMIEELMSLPPSPPMWASAYQKVEWVRRHDTPSRFPAWEVADQVVLDIRDYFADVMEREVISFSDGV